MKMKYLFILGLFSLIIACNRNDEAMFPDSFTEENQTSQATNESSTSQQSSSVQAQRKIIRSGQITMEVDELDQASQKLKTFIKENGGYISNSSMSSSDYVIKQHIDLRVNIADFDATIDFIKSQAKTLDSENIRARDVTEEFIDVESRLTTKKQVRDRYVAVLKDKAKTVEEVLLAEGSILQIQEEIEAKEGRLKYLRDQVALSTISIDLYQELDYKPLVATYSFNFISKVKSAALAGWHFVLYLLIALVGIWPLLLVGSLFLLLRKRIIRKWFQKTTV